MEKGFKNLLNTYVSINEEEWSIFQNKFRLIQVQKGEILQDSDKIAKEMNYVVSGGIRSFLEKDGEEITWNFYFPGGIATDFKSYLIGSPSPLRFIAIDHTQIISLSQSDISELALSIPKIVVLEKVFAQHAFLDMRSRMESFLFQSPEERYQNLIRTNSILVQKLPNKDIATFLGITPQSLSRIKSRVLKTKVN